MYVVPLIPPPFPSLVPARSVGFRMVVTICFFGPWLWIELLDELCFMVLLKSVDIIPTEIVELLALFTPVTWIVPEGCNAASIPFCFAWGEASECLGATFFLMTPF